MKTLSALFFRLAFNLSISTCKSLKNLTELILINKKFSSVSASVLKLEYCVGFV
jgi:hypothetical protein